jgi:hypothetical protein
LLSSLRPACIGIGCLASARTIPPMKPCHSRGCALLRLRLCHSQAERQNHSK